MGNVGYVNCDITLRPWGESNCVEIGQSGDNCFVKSWQKLAKYASLLWSLDLQIFRFALKRLWCLIADSRRESAESSFAAVKVYFGRAGLAG